MTDDGYAEGYMAQACENAWAVFKAEQQKRHADPMGGYTHEHARNWEMSWAATLAVLAFLDNRGKGQSES